MTHTVHVSECRSFLLLKAVVSHFFRLCKSAFSLSIVETLDEGVNDGRAEWGRGQTLEEVKFGTNVTYICITIFFSVSRNIFWDLELNGIGLWLVVFVCVCFASDPLPTLNADKWFTPLPLFLSNSNASTSTFADVTPGSVQSCSLRNISPVAKAAQ